MKPIADMLWTLVRWTLPLTVAAVVAAFMIGADRLGEQVRQRVEARLRAELPGLAVQVRAASLVDGEGILVRGLAVVDPALPPQHRQLVWIDELHLACGTTLTELASGMPRITAVRVRRPSIHAVRAADGRWSLTRLLEARPPAPGAGVPVSIEEATVLLEDARIQRRLSLRQVGVDLAAPSADGTVDVRGSGSGDLFERVAFTGRLTPADKSFDITGRIESLDVSQRLEELLGAAGHGGWLVGLRGRVGLDWRLAGSLARPAEIAAAVTGRLESGHFQHAALPFAMSDVQATFRADRSGAVCERLEAHSGSTLISGSARLGGWGAAADWDLRVEAERLVVGRHWEGLLPAALAAQWSKLLPAGEIDVSATLARRAGQIEPDVSVRCRNVSLTHYRFPYRLDRTVGTVTYKGRTLGLHLTGQAGGHPVHVSGSIDTAVPGGQGRVEVRGDGMRIDDALLAAMPPRSAEIVRSLRGQGTFDFLFRHERGPTWAPQGHANFLDIRLAHCSLAYAGFPYPLSNVNGLIRMEQGRWTIRGITGSNDSGVIHCTGGLVPIGTDDGELTLQLTGRGVALEQELRDALPSGMRRIWDDVDPRGAAEFSATVRHRVKQRHTEVELEATPQGDTVSIEPSWFPYRLERMQGQLVWRDGRLQFKQVRGRHDRTTLATDGSCRFTPDGGWHVSFERLAADRFRVDHDLLQALPKGIQQAIEGVRLRGLLSLEGSLDVHSTAGTVVTRPGGVVETVPGPAAASWDVHLDMEQAAIDVGVPLEHVHGGLRLVGRSDEQTWQSQGDLAIDSGMIRGVQLTAVEGPLVMDPQGVRFGSPAVVGRRLSARVAGGTLLVDGSVAAGEGGGFTVSASLGDADLERLAGDATGATHRYRGKVHGGIEISGSRAGTHSLAGRGQMRLRDADIYELPVIVALLKILRVKAPDRNAFSSSVLDFHIEGPHVYLDNIELSGDAISLVGAGEIDFETNLRLTFRSIMGDSETQLPAMKRLLGGASGQFMLIHVDGTLADPVPTTEAFPTLAAAVQKLQSRRQEQGIRR